MIENLTPLILTYNEAPNIERTLKKLTWAKQIVVIDSYSNDETLNILSIFSQVILYQRIFDTHANQWNHGLQKIQTPWVLSLDADYFVTDELIREIAALPETIQVDGYFIKFKYCVFGKPLRGTILPPRLALFRKDNMTYIDDGHTQFPQLSGSSKTLSSYLYHDDRKSLARWLWAQDRYMIIESQKLLDTPLSQLSWGDRIRRLTVIAPFIVLVYCLILKGGILDGWPGWYYALQRLLAEILLSIHLIEVRNSRCTVHNDTNS